jgi:hypothetical protein
MPASPYVGCPFPPQKELGTVQTRGGHLACRLRVSSAAQPFSVADSDKKWTLLMAVCAWSIHRYSDNHRHLSFN